MIRRISTKWVLAVLAAVVVPFAGFGFFVHTRVSDRLSGEVVRHHLLSMAAGLADRIDAEIDERRQDAEILAVNALVQWYVGDYTENEEFFGYVQTTFDRLIVRSKVYDFVMAVDATGRLAAWNNVDADGAPLPERTLELLEGHDFSGEEWFGRAMREGFAMVDFHPSQDLVSGLGIVGAPADDHHIGFARRIEPLPNHEADLGGVIFLVMNWRFIQDAVSSYGVRRLVEGNGAPAAVGEDIYKSSYAWIWKSDADTIIAHPSRELYGVKVSEPPIELPQLVEAARSAAWGMYPDYTFRDVTKKAAFKRCKGPDEGGYGWVVGVGVDDEDIYAPVEELSRQLFTGSGLVLVAAVLMTIFVARRTTRPISELQQHTRRIAGGDLDTRIELRTNDELGDLAEDFNRMTSELKENREQLVRAEKEAAWREMARQVAHEIKNPLTPISLSASLLKRSHDEGSKDFDHILDRTITLIQRQVENMREIARDFYAFAGEHRELREVDVGALVDEVLELNAAWAEQQGVRCERLGEGGLVHADPDELRRALINLVSNALEAMSQGGDLSARVAKEDGYVVVEIRDTGEGVSAEVEPRLFEPYFTTRSSGTGLGLAIVRRVVEDMGGRVELFNAPGGAGAIARILLPKLA